MTLHKDRTRWTADLIERAVRPIVAERGTFPSNADLVAAGRGDLASAINRHGGFLAWADKLGVARQPSDSDTGWAGERLFVDLCRRQGLGAERAGHVKAPFDVIVEGVLRVDVKAASYAEYGACRGWFYRIGKTPQADLIVCVQLDAGDFYALPWFRCPTGNVTISRGGGKYQGIRNDWLTIRAMVQTRAAEVARLTPIAG